MRQLRGLVGHSVERACGDSTVSAERKWIISKNNEINVVHIVNIEVFATM